MTSESSKVMACSSAMAPVTLIGSPQKAFTSHSCSSSFTSASVAPWRTVASTIESTRHNAQTTNSKPRTTRPITQFRTSLICWLLPDGYHTKFRTISIYNPQSKNLIRHFEDLRDGTHGGSASRKDKETHFENAVKLLAPIARQVLNEMNINLLRD